jgi:hypothetical protein
MYRWRVAPAHRQRELLHVLCAAFPLDELGPRAHTAAQHVNVCGG